VPRTVHILSQYLWPDDAPTGAYAEQIADALLQEGVRVSLVGGQGQYRAGRRSRPRTNIERVTHYAGTRGNLPATAREYASVRAAFKRYITAKVRADDIVIVTSAPPTTVFLERAIRERGALGVYWLQDYYPQLIRGVWDAPSWLRGVFGSYWTSALGAWPQVVKAAGNLGYHGPNALVIRNWNTLDLGSEAPFIAGTALYSGNLGYAHDIASLVELCAGLRADGYQITVRGDGPGLRQLPPWIRTERPFADLASLIKSYWAAELHLVAGHPLLGDAVFPSKFWNARATGRRVLAAGFSGVMAEELEIARAVDFRSHLPQWTRYVLSLLGQRVVVGNA
jgi:hypothetical protein